MEPGTIVFEGKTKKGLDVVIRYPKAEDLMALLGFINGLVREGAPILAQKEITELKEVLGG